MQYKELNNNITVIGWKFAAYLSLWMIYPDLCSTLAYLMWTHRRSFVRTPSSIFYCNAWIELKVFHQQGIYCEFSFILIVDRNVIFWMTLPNFFSKFVITPLELGLQSECCEKISACNTKEKSFFVFFSLPFGKCFGGSNLRRMFGIYTLV